MTHARLKASLWAALLIGAALPAFAQFPVELACPPQTGPIFQARDNVTQGTKQWACVDNLGNVTLQVNAQPLPANLGVNVSGFRTTANSLQVVNYFGSGVNANLGTQSNVLVYPGATGISSSCGTAPLSATFCQEMANDSFESSATASTSTVVGNECCANANSGSYPILAWNRVTIKAGFGTAATNPNARWWLGLSVFANASSLGINGTATLGSTAYAQDLPNKTTIGFRCNQSVTPDWQAVEIQANNAGAISRVLDTGVLCDAGIHVWEMILTPDQTTIAWYIDGRQVAQAPNIIDTTVSNSNVLDIMSQLFFTGDNKNTATQIGVTFFYALMQERLN